MDRLRAGGVVAALLVAMSCSERARQVQSDAELKRAVDQMMPAVERATGLRFKHRPLVLRRTRADVRDYVIHKFDKDLPLCPTRHLGRTFTG